ncbi:3'-5' exonuclease [Parafrankia discariae]|uniref:3'-5' exonuclease n=1 Tax=Parafrankia discariae TaxID=365528 RepID=UPI0003748584|nr:hypothetical protein [Parafrankia discariae]
MNALAMPAAALAFEKIVFVDLETTALDPTRGGESWEFGLIVRRRGKPDEEWQVMVRPDLDRADPQALRIGRYYERTAGLSDADGSWHDLAGESDDGWRRWSDPFAFARWLAPTLDGAVLIGSNASFDAGHLRPWLRHHGQALICHYRPVDIGAVAWGFYLGTAFGERPDGAGADERALTLPWSSTSLAEGLGVHSDPAHRHEALADARHVRDVFDRVLSLAGLTSRTPVPVPVPYSDEPPF